MTYTGTLKDVNVSVNIYMYEMILRVFHAPGEIGNMFDIINLEIVYTYFDKFADRHKQSS